MISMFPRRARIYAWWGFVSVIIPRSVRSPRECAYIYTQTPVFPLISNSLRTENFSYIINKQILDDTKYFPLPFPRENFLKKLSQDRFLKRIITRMKKKKKKIMPFMHILRTYLPR